jgi:hypothetical protein
LLQQAKLVAQTKQIKALTAEVRMLGSSKTQQSPRRRAIAGTSAAGSGFSPLCGASAASPASSDPFAAGYSSDWPAEEQLPSAGAPDSQGGSTDQDRSQRQSDPMRQAAMVDVLDISRNTSRHFMPSDVLQHTAADDSQQAGGTGAAPAPVGSPATAGGEQAATPRLCNGTQGAAADGINILPVTPVAAGEEEANFQQQDQQQEQQGCDYENDIEAEQPDAGAAMRAGTPPARFEGAPTAADSTTSTVEEPAATDGSSQGEGGNTPETQPLHAEAPTMGQSLSTQRPGGLASPSDTAWVEGADDGTPPSSRAGVTEQSPDVAAQEQTADAAAFQAEDVAILAAQAGEDSQAHASAELSGAGVAATKPVTAADASRPGHSAWSSGPSVGDHIDIGDAVADLTEAGTS